MQVRITMTPESKTPHTFHAVVHGRVQGVGYRVYAMESARRYHLTGWVRNLKDGTVEVYAEGEELKLTELLTDLHRGPILGYVEDIDIEWEKKKPEFDSFNIRR